MSRLLLLALSVVIISCQGSPKTTRVGSKRPDVCITEEARAVTEQPEFEEQYNYCARGNRAIGSRAIIACMEEHAGLPEECASCYSWFKACVLRSCFNACHRPRPKVYCSICQRTSCQGQFLQCSGTTKFFPGSKG